MSYSPKEHRHKKAVLQLFLGCMMIISLPACYYYGKPWKGRMVGDKDILMFIHCNSDTVRSNERGLLLDSLDIDITIVNKSNLPMAILPETDVLDICFHSANGKAITYFEEGRSDGPGAGAYNIVPEQGSIYYRLKICTSNNYPDEANLYIEKGKYMLNLIYWDHYLHNEYSIQNKAVSNTVRIVVQ